MSTEIHPPSESAHLVQGGGVIAVGGDDQTVTAQQLLAVGKGKNGHVIGVATEAINMPGGDNSLVGAESSAIDLSDGSSNRPKYGHQVTAKVRWDWMARLLTWRPLRNSAGYCVSAQPDTAFQAGLKCDPGSVSKAVILARDNPGVPFGEVSGDMCEWRDGRLYLPIIVDDVRWGIPLTHLGDK